MNRKELGFVIGMLTLAVVAVASIHLFVDDNDGGQSEVNARVQQSEGFKNVKGIERSVNNIQEALPD